MPSNKKQKLQLIILINGRVNYSQIWNSVIEAVKMTDTKVDIE